MKKQTELIEVDAGRAADFFSESEMKLIDSTIEARDRAYAPYSNFKVGAAALHESGQIWKGNNQENAAYPSGLCAERVLLNYVKANYPDENIQAVAIITEYSDKDADHLPVPCGACLQTILETEQRQENELRIILIAKGKYYVAEGVKQFLPFQFNL